MPPNVRTTATRLLTPFTVHVASLCGAAIVLVWVNRHQWFDLDEWAFLVGRGVTGGRENLFEPHNEHWVTLPILVWRALFTVFGARTYAPYLAVLLVAHLLTVHLLWRVMVRSHVAAWTATLLCMPVAILGVGWENLISAFQITFVAPVGLGLCALLLLPARARLVGRDAIVIALLIAALMCSGAGVTMVFVVAFCALLRRSLRAAAVIAVVPGAVYLAWFAIWGHDTGTAPSEPVRVAVQKLPAMIWRGLGAAIDGFTGLAVVAPVLLVLLTWFLVVQIAPDRKRYAPALAMALGAPVFLAVASVRRTALGVESAAGSRYSYLVVVFLLPALGLGFDALFRGQARELKVGVLAAATAVLLVVQVPVLNSNAKQWAAIEQEQKHRVMAAAELAREGGDFLAAIPVPQYMPDLTIDDVARLDRDGRLPGNVSVSDEDRLTALSYLQVTMTEKPELSSSANPPVVVAVAGASVAPVAGNPECIDVTARSLGPIVTLRLTGPTSFEVLPSASGAVGVQLRSDTASGRLRAFSVVGGGSSWLNVNISEGRVDLVLPPQGITTLCDVAALGEEFVASVAG